ncbi:MULTISPECIES: hypothetical protein [unclassified Streptomyces]|uniref:hypothetical protein n=1 Tax=unclassified Streptomyces TaxID=2593676 RepID=UPI00131A05C0|nr:MULTISPECIES: hypothetical protein [unclassified Streptomyces]MYT28856.1 hypothetical protein [Streptomyces sp. SID8354]
MDQQSVQLRYRARMLEVGGDGARVGLRPAVQGVFAGGDQAVERRDVLGGRRPRPVAGGQRR